MTDTTAQEPTMEEILASIRRIISEDDAPAAEAAPAPATEAEPEPSPALVDAAPSEPEPAPPEEEEILDLTDRYEAPAAQTIGDLDVTAPADPEPELEPFPTAFAEPARPAAPEPAPNASFAPDDSLVGESAAAASASAFAGLSAAFRQPEPIPTGGVGPTIDDLARSLLRPMLKDWLDANLPGIVEAAVRKEVERISRSAG